jgi:hypothetical protein
MAKVLVGLAFFLFIGAAYSQIVKGNSHSIDTQERATKKDSSSKIIPSLVNPNPSTEYSEQQPAKDSENIATQNRIANYTAWLTIFTGALVFATVLLAIVGFVQNRNISRQVDASESQVLSSQDQVNVSRKQTDIIEMNSQRQLRAYIGINGSADEPTGETWLELEIKNYGQTPAFKMQFWLNLGIFGYPKTDFIHKSINDSMSGRITLAPGATRTISLPKPWKSQKEADEINKGSIAIYIWGEITYGDAWGVGRKTGFRLYVNSATKSGKSEMVSISFCDEGNEAT